MEDSLLQLADNLTLLGFMLYVWSLERRERVELQQRYTNHLEREVVSLSSEAEKENV